MGLRNSLQKNGYKVYYAYDGKQALKIIREEKIDFIILDLMLPEIDGMTLCKEIRKTLNIPIIMLTAKDDYVDRILGLELGADDYVTKPFNTRELIARIKAVYRRFNKEKNYDETINYSGFKLSIADRSLHKENEEITLTAKEFDLLKTLITRPGRVYTRENLFEIVWDSYAYDTRTVDVHISKLRDKIENDPSNPQYIKTKWGVGYYFKRNTI